MIEHIPNGYIVIARKIRKSPLWLALKCTHRIVMIELLLQAQFQDGPVVRNGEIIELMRGQIATSYQLLVDSIGDKDVTIKVVRNALEKLIKYEFLTKDEVKAGAKIGLLLTIINYEYYQNADNYKKSIAEVNEEREQSKQAKTGRGKGMGKEAENPDGASDSVDIAESAGRVEGITRADLGQGEGRVGAISNNVKELNKSNNSNNDSSKPIPRNKKIPYSEDSKFYQMAVYFHNKIMEHAEVNKVGHLVRDADLQKWADEFRKIIELDKRDTLELKEIIDWSTTDSFWSSNILSPKKLREKYADLGIRMKKGPQTGNRPMSKFERNKQLLQEKMQEARSNDQRRDVRTDQHYYGSLPDGGME